LEGKRRRQDEGLARRNEYAISSKGDEVEAWREGMNMPYQAEEMRWRLGEKKVN
jgi:hypothetical protein